MSYSVELLEEVGVVRLAFIGQVRLEHHVEGRAAAARVLEERGWTRLLVDASEVDAQMSFTDDFEFTADHRTSHPPFVRIAVVHRPDEQKRFGFIENVARNRGADLATFTDPERALAWLMGT